MKKRQLSSTERPEHPPPYRALQLKDQVTVILQLSSYLNEGIICKISPSMLPGTLKALLTLYVGPRNFGKSAQLRETPHTLLMLSSSLKRALFQVSSLFLIAID